MLYIFNSHTPATHVTLETEHIIHLMQSVLQIIRLSPKEPCIQYHLSPNHMKSLRALVCQQFGSVHAHLR